MNILKDRQEVIFNKILDFIKKDDSTIIIESISLPEIQNLDINNALYLCLTQEGIITPEMMIKLNDQKEFVDLKNIINIFEVLGLFSMSKSCSIYLCDELIDACAKNKSLDVTNLEEVVYIHECAHYIHYHLNSGNFRNCPFNVQERRLYVETFAQLITHVICKEMSDEHFKVFEKLKEGQQDVYTLYNDYAIAFSKDYLLNLFLTPQPNNDENLIDFIKKDYDVKITDPDRFIAWSWDSLLFIFQNLTDEKNKLLDKILHKEVLQEKINENPEKIVHDLKPVWKALNTNPNFKNMNWWGYNKEGGLISDLDEIGL